MASAINRLARIEVTTVARTSNKRDFEFWIVERSFMNELLKSAKSKKTSAPTVRSIK